jgi:hypothetical protein
LNDDGLAVDDGRRRAGAVVAVGGRGLPDDGHLRGRIVEADERKRGDADAGRAAGKQDQRREENAAVHCRRFGG